MIAVRQKRTAIYLDQSGRGKSFDQSLKHEVYMLVKNNPDFTDGEAEALSTEEQAESAEKISEATETEETSEAETEEIEGKTEETSEEETEESAPSKIKIGDKEFEETELKDIVEKGAKIKEWETKMPGFNVDTFMPDYTRKSQRLAEMEKRMSSKSQNDQKELEEMGVDDDQIKAFEKVAKHLGFVRNSDLVQDSVEAQKEAFIARHPEYAPKVKDSDVKWAKLMEGFALFDWKNHPDKVEYLLEKTHEEVSKSWQEMERGQKIRETVVAKKAQAAAASIGGAGGKGVSKTQTSNTALADKYRAMGWNEEDIKEILT